MSQTPLFTRLHTLCGTALLAASPLFAQGIGTAGAVGERPVLSLEGHAVAAPSRLSVENLSSVPGHAWALFVSSAIARVPATSLGLSSGSVGLDPSASGFTSLGPLPAPRSGRWSGSFLPPPSLAGQWLHAQVLQLQGPTMAAAALSDSLMMPFGNASGFAPVWTPSGTSRIRPAAVASDASLSLSPPGPVQDLELLPLALTARSDPRNFDGTRPALLELGTHGTVLHLADGSQLARVRDPAGRQGFHLMRPMWPHSSLNLPFVLPRLGREAWSEEVAASPFAPWIALTSEEPLAALGGVSIVIFRTDGFGPRPEEPYAVQLPTGFEIDEESLTFLDGCLLVTDGDAGRVARIALSPPFLVQELALPPVGGLRPSECDDGFAWSADGSLAAITAGHSETVRDVFVLGSTGPIRNATQFPGSYEEVDHADPEEGRRLALAPDASRIVYARDHLGGRELFTQSPVIGGQPLQVTPDAWFEDTIEALIGIHCVRPDVFLFLAGAQNDEVDLYRCDLRRGTLAIENLTVSSGHTSAPFDVGATLRLSATPVSGGERVGLQVIDRASAIPTWISAGANGTSLQFPQTAPSRAPRAVRAGVHFLALRDASGSKIVDAATGALQHRASPNVSSLRFVGRRADALLHIVVSESAGESLLEWRAGQAPRPVLGLQATRIEGLTTASDGTRLVSGLDRAGRPAIWTLAPGSSTARTGPLAAPLLLP